MESSVMWLPCGQGRISGRPGPGGTNRTNVEKSDEDFDIFRA
jgi:hypothetical protein